VVLSTVAAAGFAACAGAADFQWLPQKNLFEPLIADPTYPTFALKYSAVAHRGWRAETDMGGEFSIAALKLENGAKAQFSIDGGVAARFDISRITNDFEIADFSLVLPVDYSIGPLAMRFMYWHTSSHVGDDYIISNSLSPSQLSKHVTDDFRFLASYKPVEFLRLYGGGGWAFNQIPHVQKRWRTQFGAEASTPGPQSLFAAFDFQSLERNNWNPSFTARAGVKSAGEYSAVSAFCEFFSGRTPYLGFMDSSETRWSLGFGFEL